jgi:hypothetical protein
MNQSKTTTLSRTKNWRAGTATYSIFTTAIALFLAITNTTSADEFAGQRWPAGQNVSVDRIDHTAFDQLLQKYVDADGMVAYRAWHANANDRRTLTDYLIHLSRANPSAPASREAKLAYWINAYNAVTIEGILRVYPTSSIRNHTARVVGYNIWKNLYLYAGDQKFSLEDIEHKILRKMNEPRIHFAIVCASIGCPRLLNRAYVAGSLEQQLVINTQDFFSREQNLKITSDGQTLALSKIMEWYGSDFAATPDQQVKQLAKYFPQAARQVVASQPFRVTYQNYDWGLNAQQ